MVVRSLGGTRAEALGLVERLRRACLRFTPCTLLAYNLAPLLVGFMGGLAGALLPLLVVEAAAPQFVQHTMVVLANIAAGASAGIAAAAARRPARVLVRGVDAVRVGDAVRVDVIAVNESSVVSRDVTLYVSGFVQEGFEWYATIVEERGTENIYIVSRDGGECCVCMGCVIEGVETGKYRVKTVARAPQQGVRVRGVHASIMPPRSMLEAPTVEVELVEFGECVGALRDCSSVRRCGFRGRLAEADAVLFAKVLSGGEAIAILAAPVRGSHEASIDLRVEVAGDPVPSVTEYVSISLSLEKLEEGWLAYVEAATLEESVQRWFHVQAARCRLGATRV